MAQMSISPPDALIGQLERLSSGIDDVAAKMLDAGMKPLEKELKRNISRHVKSGELLGSLKAMKAKKNKKGIWSKYLTFVGEAKGKKYSRKSKSGEAKQEDYRNYQKVLALEYGTSKQSATPVIRPAIESTSAEVTAEMQRVFEQEVAR